MSAALAALAAAEAALDIRGGPGAKFLEPIEGQARAEQETQERQAQVRTRRAVEVRASLVGNRETLPPQLGFAERGSELLAKMEAAMLAEVRTHPIASGKALDKASAIVPSKSANPPRPVLEDEPGMFVEDALAKSLARMEHSMLLHVRSEEATHRGMHGGAITLAHQTIRAVQQRDDLAGRSAFFKTGKRGAPPKRPASAPLVHPPTKSGEEALRVRQRAYDDARRGRLRHVDAPSFCRYPPSFCL